MDDGHDPHILVFHDGSPRADVAVRQAAEVAFAWGARLTILTVACLERVPPVRRCCGPSPAYWNSIMREVAAEDLARAGRAAEFPDAELVTREGLTVADVVAREANARGCTMVVVPAARVRLRSRTPLQRGLQRRLAAPVVVPPLALPAMPSRQVAN